MIIKFDLSKDLPVSIALRLESWTPLRTRSEHHALYMCCGYH